MAWLQVQAASRKPGGGDADVLNRLRLGRAQAAAKAAEAAAQAAKEKAHFKPVEAQSKAAKSSKDVHRRPSSTSAGGEGGLPSWVSVGATLMYRSRTSSSRLAVTVSEVDDSRVKVVFCRDKTTDRKSVV